MDQQNNLYKIKKEEALDILDRTIRFVNSCDSKASVVIGVSGVLLTILSSNERVTEIKSIIKLAMGSGIWYGVLYLGILVCAVMVCVFGIVKLLEVLFPKTNCDDLNQEGIELNSHIFFGGICKNPTYNQYKEKVMNYNEDEYLNDIISQIYLNSIICERKFKNFKVGVVATFLGLLSFLVVLIIGKLLY
ncbi:Pycsar system effector family protein [Clostridium sp. YIM B02569]|uniref:Pycsar system effector family protein n=1 Tax=Clostridium sp. YIM B02569 TaxID=2911967 RepID=UPI001EEB5244|nr:Pycsar system effector family protein [Clostridium sp. YIM B02569]